MVSMSRSKAKSSDVPAAGPQDQPPPPVLPGERSADPVLVDQAVWDLNRIWLSKGFETARAVGEYVLTCFFQDDTESFRARGKHHHSFRALAARDDLQVSHTFLWRAVALVEQLRVLPADLADQLGYSHHLALLPVKDLAVKIALARQAVDQGLTRRQLEAAVRQAKEPSRAGRPPLPVFVMSVNRLRKLLDDDRAFDELDKVSELGQDQARAALDTVVAMRQRCERLQQELEARLAQQGDQAE